MVGLAGSPRKVGRQFEIGSLVGQEGPVVVGSLLDSTAGAIKPAQLFEERSLTFRVVVVMVVARTMHVNERARDLFYSCREVERVCRALSLSSDVLRPARAAKVKLLGRHLDCVHSDADSEISRRVDPLDKRTD